jgi:hypothetical protein
MIPSTKGGNLTQNFVGKRKEGGGFTSQLFRQLPTWRISHIEIVCTVW